MTHVLTDLECAFPEAALTTLNACGCPVCLGDAARQRLLTTPRRHVRQADLEEYLSAVSLSGDAAGAAAEAAHFAPVIAARIAANAPPHPFGLALSFQPLGDAGFPQPPFAPAARHTLTLYFIALLRGIEAAPERFGQLSALELISAAAVSGLDIAPLLADVARAESHGALLSLAGEIRAQGVLTARGDHLAGWWDRAPAASEAAARRWLLSRGLRARLERAFFEEADPQAAALLSDAHWALAATPGAE